MKVRGKNVIDTTVLLNFFAVDSSANKCDESKCTHILGENLEAMCESKIEYKMQNCLA
jgi:hypothetical protein